MITLSYDLNKDDYSAFNYYFLNIHDSRRTKFKYALTAVCGLMVAVILLQSYASLGSLKVPLFLFIAAPIYLWLSRSKWFIAMITKWKYNKGKGLNYTGNITLTLEEDGISSKSAIGESKILWSAFRLLKENQDYFFLFMNMKRTLIIPKRIFLLPQEEHDVKSFIERKLA